MPEKVPSCLRCGDSHIFLSVRPRERYAQAQLCDCISDPCKTCKGTGFFFTREKNQKEIAVICPDCEQLKQRVKLYNNARIPRRYLNSRLLSFVRDEQNHLVFVLLVSIFRLLPQRLNNQNPFQDDSDDLKGMVLMGPPGTGKTHLMAGFAYQCTVRNISCIFQSFAELLSELRQGYSDGKSDIEIIEPHLQTDVLIIDDMGKGRNTDWELGILDMLISERYNRNQIIMVTTNYTEDENSTIKEQIRTRDKSETEQFFADTISRRVGERIHSRLKEMCYFENLFGDDRRLKDDFDD